MPISDRLLMGPGPSNPYPEVAEALAGPVIGHLDPDFLAIMVPGGLGVPEALMYDMLGGAAKGSLALVFPVASRLMNMFVDVTLGVVAFRLLRSLTGAKTAHAERGRA